MLPIVDYGGIAIVVPKIAAVSGVNEDDGRFGFDVHLTGNVKPIAVVFDSPEQANDNRDELVAIIARYYYMKDFGPDFDPENIEEMLSDEGDEDVSDDDDEDINEKH